nr:hypothetical protein [uncultured bacterium]
MRISAPSSLVGRAAVRERHRRGRINAPPLRSLYPALASLQVEFEFSDRVDFIPSPQVTVFHPPAPAYFRFACPYSDCDGEFDLTGVIDTAVNAHGPGTSGQLYCQGTRHRGVRCTLCLDYSISPHPV